MVSALSLRSPYEDAVAAGRHLDSDFYFYNESGFYDPGMFEQGGGEHGLGALANNLDIATPTPKPVAATTGALLGTYDGKQCYANASLAAGYNCTSQSICNYKCHFAQCVNAGLAPASFCGGGGTTVGGTPPSACVASGGAAGANGTCICGAGLQLNSQGTACVAAAGSGGLTCILPLVPNPSGTGCVQPASTPTALTCISPLVPNSTVTACVNPATGSSSPLTCATGYMVDPTGTFCVANTTPVSTTATTTTTGVLADVESFLASYWLYIAIGFVGYELLVKKKR